MGSGNRRILVIGAESPLLEGVADLLLVSGYDVKMSSSWAETSYALNGTPPHLAIIDLSNSPIDAYRMSTQIRKTSQWAKVPILFISFSGDDRIRELQRWSKKKDPHMHFFAHTVLSMDGLLDKVEACLA
jgi:DNA-binding response OmpR family regulator